MAPAAFQGCFNAIEGAGKPGIHEMRGRLCPCKERECVLAGRERIRHGESLAFEHLHGMERESVLRLQRRAILPSEFWLRLISLHKCQDPVTVHALVLIKHQLEKEFEPAVLELQGTQVTPGLGEPQFLEFLFNARNRLAATLR